VIDADALNILSKNRSWLSLLPSKSILTPHPKELERLIGKWDSEEENSKKRSPFTALWCNCRYERSANAYHRCRKVYRNYRKCGFGHSRKRDVLTGIITSLLAQSHEPITAAVLGAYLHGLAADIACQKRAISSSLRTSNIWESILSITK
jgi:NAD(P)H-hydrate repair Nnr-like enzyme with NAD(P)H-hydrate dehydratase domain